jgi:hypothetical protein
MVLFVIWFLYLFLFYPLAFFERREFRHNEIFSTKRTLSWKNEPPAIINVGIEPPGASPQTGERILGQWYKIRHRISLRIF